MKEETERKKKTKLERDTLSKKGEWNKNKKKRISHFRLNIFLTSNFTYLHTPGLAQWLY